jgi:hypothetical protein
MDIGDNEFVQFVVEACESKSKSEIQIDLAVSDLNIGEQDPDTIISNFVL